MDQILNIMDFVVRRNGARLPYLLSAITGTLDELKSMAREVFEA